MAARRYCPCQQHSRRRPHWLRLWQDGLKMCRPQNIIQQGLARRPLSKGRGTHGGWQWAAASRVGSEQLPRQSRPVHDPAGSRGKVATRSRA